MKRFYPAASLALAVVVVAGLTGPAAAGTQVPFAGSFEGERTDRIPLTQTTVLDRWEMAGTAAHLGRFELVLEAVVDFGTVPPTGAGTATFVAANGDRLFAEFAGYSEPVAPGFIRIVEIGIITGGTGRFAGASGSYTSRRLTSLFTNETVGSFEGSISAPGS
jgi:hypothetical protein